MIRGSFLPGFLHMAPKVYTVKISVVNKLGLINLKQVKQALVFILDCGIIRLTSLCASAKPWTQHKPP